MRSLTADYLDRLRFTHSQLATLRALGEFRKHPPNPTLKSP